MSNSTNPDPTPPPGSQAIEMSVEDEHAKFTFFSTLPLQIRDMIWAFGCSEERIIDVRAVAISGLQDEDFFMRPADDETPRPFMVKSFTYTVPAILHTSQEARKVGLKHYSLEFRMNVERKVGPATVKISTPARILCQLEPRHHLPIASTKQGFPSEAQTDTIQ